MKSRIVLYLSSIAMVIIFWSALSNETHSAGGKTGSPADGNNCTACHMGTTMFADGWILTDIPSTGYEPGHTYTITLVGTHAGVKKFGFELTAENADQAKVGQFIITNFTETQLSNMKRSVTHTDEGLIPTKDQKYWSFNWVAPSAGTGAVTFYASLNASNGDDNLTGDVIYNTEISYIENLSSSIKTVPRETAIKLFPNPAYSILNIKYNKPGKYELKLIDLIGREILNRNVVITNEVYKLDISNIPFGMYFFQLSNKETLVIKQFLKK